MKRQAQTDYELPARLDGTMALEDLLWVEAKNKLGSQVSEELPEIAYRALLAGLESPSLIELAGLIKPDWRDTEPVWKKTLKEFHLPELTESQAVHFLALPVARQMCSAGLQGQLPILAALTSLEALNSAHGHPAFLHAFCPLYSSWDYLIRELGDHSEEALMEQEFREAAEKLLRLPLFDPRNPSAHEPNLFRSTLKF
jgi:hypothetical protein